MNSIAHDELLDSHQTASLLNVEPATLHAWRYRGYGPSWVVIGKRSIRYRYSVICDYVRSGEVQPRSRGNNLRIQ
jgi:hypothetical protein